MTNEPNTTGRRVRVGTLHGVIEGLLRVGSSVRTLDYLNKCENEFVTLETVEATGRSRTLSVNTRTIRWIIEMDSPPRPSRASEGHVAFHRSPIRVDLGDGEIRGFIHMPQGGNPRMRWNLQRNSFIAVTSASVVDPLAELAAGFIAVNRRHIFTAELLGTDDEPQDDLATPAGVESVR